MISNCIFILLLFTSTLFPYNTDEKAIHIKSDAIVDIILEGYNGFSSFTIAELHIDSGSTATINTDYEGLVLLIYPQGQRYPLILSDDKLEINIHSPGVKPDFINSQENEFLYDYLSKYRKLEYQLMLLKETMSEMESSDPFFPELEKEQLRVQAEREKLKCTLTTNEYPMASTLLAARLLNESTYNIKTSFELNERKEAYHQFVKENAGRLIHSDMLMELARQYFMMHEYVSFIPEGTKDIMYGKMEFNNAIISSAGNWIDLLQDMVAAEKVLDFCVGLYYDRSMVGQATGIIDAYREIAFCPGTGSIEFNIVEEVTDLSVVDSKGFNKMPMSALNLYKVLALVADTCNISKVETIALARLITEKKIAATVVVVPSGQLTENYKIMDRMYTGTFYFAQDEGWYQQNIKSHGTIPLFILLDKDNKVLEVSPDRHEIINEILKERY